MKYYHAMILMMLFLIAGKMSNDRLTSGVALFYAAVAIYKFITEKTK